MPRLIEQFRAVAFDLDGTLVDSAPDLADAANAMLKARGLKVLLESRIAMFIGDGIDALVERALGESADRSPGPAELREAAAVFRSLYGKRLFERGRVYPGVVEGLRALREANIARCCITNKHSTFTLPLLDAAGLAGLLDFALCADRPEHRKPAPYLLVAACQRLGISPAKMLYVGDSRADIEAARAAGCPVAVVDYGYSQGLSLAEQEPDWIIGSLEGLATLPPADTDGRTSAERSSH